MGHTPLIVLNRSRYYCQLYLLHFHNSVKFHIMLIKASLHIEKTQSMRQIQGSWLCSFCSSMNLCDNWLQQSHCWRQHRCCTCLDKSKCHVKKKVSHCDVVVVSGRTKIDPDTRNPTLCNYFFRMHLVFSLNVLQKHLLSSKKGEATTEKMLLNSDCTSYNWKKSLCHRFAARIVTLPNAIKCFSAWAWIPLNQAKTILHSN